MFTFLSVPFVSDTMRGIVGRIVQFILKKKHGYICVTNLHGILEAQRNNAFLHILQHAAFNVPDGMPIVWFARVLGFLQTERIYGPTLMRTLCHAAEKYKFKIFLYGTTKATLQTLILELHRLHPTLSIVGSYAPPFHTISQKELQKIRVRINSCKPHIVFVGLGSPKQEAWMYTQSKHTQANILIGVGAAFDFISGCKPQAPVWVQESGLEWLYRWYREPKRLSGRYLQILFLLPLYVCIYYFRKLFRVRKTYIFFIKKIAYYQYKLRKR